MTLTEAVVTVLVVGICVGLPVFGLTLRFAFKPVLEAWVSLKPSFRAPSDELEALKVRVAAVEARAGHRLDASTVGAIVYVDRDRVELQRPSKSAG